MTEASSRHDSQRGRDGLRRSVWLDEAFADEASASQQEAPPLSSDEHADVCIVGGGYTGLWTALHLVDRVPGIAVSLLEASVCGFGASGRNGGFVLPWWAKARALVDRAGRDDARWLADQSEQAIVAIGRFCDDEDVDAHFRAGGWLWTATSNAQVGSWTEALTICGELGVEPFTVLSAQELAGRTGAPVHRAGVYCPSAATVHPGRLVRGMRRVALARGVTIHELTRATRIDRETACVATPGGTVHAGAVVIATSAWSTAIPELRAQTITVGSDVVATGLSEALLDEAGWTGGEAISNSNLMVDYYRPTPNGRIVFGRGGCSLSYAGHVTGGLAISSAREHDLRARMNRLAPFTKRASVTHAWTGPVDRTVDGLPIVGRLPGRAPVFYGVGFSGNGVGPSYLAGRILASLASAQDDRWATTALAPHGRFPPEPLRFVGGHLVRAAVRRKERTEDDGRAVDGVTRRLAGLGPATFFKTSRGTSPRLGEAHDR